MYGLRSEMALDIALRKTNAGQECTSLLGPRACWKINSNTKNVKTMACCMNCRQKT